MHTVVFMIHTFMRPSVIKNERYEKTIMKEFNWMHISKEMNEQKQSTEVYFKNFSKSRVCTALFRTKNECEVEFVRHSKHCNGYLIGSSKFQVLGF